MNFRLFSLILPILLLLLMMTSGCGDRHSPDENNPFYQRGMTYRQQGKYLQAAAAFEECVRLAPQSAKGHLQLAILCEDNLNDLPRAIVEYRASLQYTHDEDRKKLIREWLNRARHALYRKLKKEYGKTTIPPVPDQPVPTQPFSPPPPSVIKKAAVAPAAPPDATAATAPVAGKKRPPRVHIVRSGESLASIARRELGRESEWTRIYEMNRDKLASPDRLQVGQQLRLPEPTAKHP